MALVATSADSVPSSNLVRITIASIGTTFRNLHWRRYFTFECSFNNNIFSFVATSADSLPSSETIIFQSKIYTLIECRHFRIYSRCALFDWSDMVFRRRNVTHRCISNSVSQPRDWGREADSTEVCRLALWVTFDDVTSGEKVPLGRILRNFLLHMRTPRPCDPLLGRVTFGHFR